MGPRPGPGIKREGSVQSPGGSGVTERLLMGAGPLTCGGSGEQSPPVHLLPAGASLLPRNGNAAC